MAKPETVGEYISGFPEPAQARLTELRELSRSAAPDAIEGLKWGSPAYVHPEGTILFVFSGHKAHANVVFTPSTREAFRGELRSFQTGKGSVKIPHDESVPTELLTRMIEFRIREHEDDGVLWM